MVSIKKTNEPIELKVRKTPPGKIVFITEGRNVQFLSEDAVIQLLDGSAVGTRRALKVKIRINGKDRVGWIHRDFVDWESLKGDQE